MNETAEITTVENESDHIKFGGVFWTRNDNGRIVANVDGTGYFSISQYQEDKNSSSYGKWNWQVNFTRRDSQWEVLSGDNEPKVIKTNCSDIVDTMEEAMQCCLNAKHDFIEDIRQLSYALGLEATTATALSRDCSDDKVKIELLNSIISHLTNMLSECARQA